MRGGIGFGAGLALVLSLMENHSILWAVIHGVLGWFYVLYRLLGYGGGLP